MAQPFAKTWTIPSTNTAAAQVQQEIVEAIEQQDYKREAVFAVRLALDEALVNAVKHGNKNDPDKTVHVEFDIDNDRMVIQIEDQGPGFVPDELPDPTAEENLSRPNGRGVMLMRAYMTEVDFNERGNRVILTKRRDCKRPQAD
ncbi:MAG: ATP-binding protein [Phycisphaeraceae bacterium]|nr:ATP-binding protein [Phycisphaeraceae bacterium]